MGGLSAASRRYNAVRRDSLLSLRLTFHYCRSLDVYARERAVQLGRVRPPTNSPSHISLEIARNRQKRLSLRIVDARMSRACPSATGSMTPQGRRPVVEYEEVRNRRLRAAHACDVGGLTPVQNADNQRMCFRFPVVISSVSVIKLPLCMTILDAIKTRQLMAIN
jgi:hypothetical protein